MSQLVRKTFAVTRSVTVSQPAVPLRVVEVIRADDGTFVIVEHACVGIETRLVREYSAVVRRNEERPRLLDARTLREDGWRFEGESIEHYPMWIDSEFGVVTMGDSVATGSSNVDTFATYPNDPDYDGKLAGAKESLEIRAKAKGGAPPATQTPAV